MGIKQGNILKYGYRFQIDLPILNQDIGPENHNVSQFQCINNRRETKSKEFIDTCEEERRAHNRTMTIIRTVTNIVGILAIGFFVFIFVALLLIFTNISKYEQTYPIFV